MKRRNTLGASSLMTESGGKRLVRRRSPSMEMDRGSRKRHRSFSPRSREDSPMDDRVGKPIIDKQHHRSHSGERYESNKYDKYDKRQTGLTPEQRYAKFDSYEKYARYQKEMEKERASYNESKLGKYDRYGKYEKESFEYSLRIGNLNYNISEKETASMLFQEFKRFGFIDVKVLGQRHDRHAFVNFIRYEDAKRARVELQNATLFGRGMHIEWSKSTLNKKLPEFIPSKRSSEDHRESAPLGHSSLRDVRDLRDLRHAVRTSSTRLSSNSISRSSTSESSKTNVVDPSACRTLFVGSLNISITERELRDLFSQYGRIESVDIKHQHAFRTAYAFIKFMTINDAINAKNDMHGKVYNSMELKVGFGRGTQPGRVWCGNITSESDIGELEKTFDRFGTIRYVDYHEGDDHAFFHFDDMDAAQTAIESLTKYRFRSSGLPLKIDWARGPKRESSEHESEFRKHTYENDRREILYEKNPVQKKRHSMPEEPYTPRKRMRDDDYGAPSSASSTRHRSSPTIYQKPQRKKPSYSSNSKSSYDAPSSYSSHHYSDYEDDHDVPTYKKRDHHTRTSFSSSGRSHVRDRSSSSANNHDIPSRDSMIKPSRHDSGYVESHKKEILENNSSSGIEVQANGSANAAAATVDDKAASVASSGGFVEDEPNVKPDTTNPETLSDLAKHFPVAWKGSMVLKNTAFPTRMHLIGGDPGVAELLLRSKDEQTAVLRISQRLRLEGPRLDEVNKRIQSAGPGGHCLLLALSGPTPSQSSPERQDNNAAAEIQQTNDENLQFRPLRSLVTYLKQKQAAGIVGLNSVDNDKNKSDSDSSGVLHAFPPCDFSQSQLCRVAPSLGQEPCKEDHIVVVVVRGSV